MARVFRARLGARDRAVPFPAGISLRLSQIFGRIFLVDDEYRIVKTVQPRDFSQRTKFPGNTGNSFDLFLGFADFLDKVPAILFAGVLGVIALLAARFDPY